MRKPQPVKKPDAASVTKNYRYCLVPQETLPALMFVLVLIGLTSLFRIFFCLALSTYGLRECNSHAKRTRTAAAGVLRFVSNWKESIREANTHRCLLHRLARNAIRSDRGPIRADRWFNLERPRLLPYPRALVPLSLKFRRIPFPSAIYPVYWPKKHAGTCCRVGGGLGPFEGK